MKRLTVDRKRRSTSSGAVASQKDAAEARAATTRFIPRNVAAEEFTLLTVREVAALLRVPVSWVYEHTRPGCQNPIPHSKLGKYLRFARTEIIEYVRALQN